jgi:L-fuculose-phosphate aldolase
VSGGASVDGGRGLRERVIATARAMNAANLNRGKSGNVSARWRESGLDGFLITPTGMRYDELVVDDIAAVGLDGRSRGVRAPSSEWRFHRDVYAARPDANAIVHAHAPFCTSLACLGRGIPSFHYMVAVAGGEDIRCAPYATFGTQALADAAVLALDGRRACLLANHGMIALGPDLERTLALAVEVETLAEIYWRALQIGEPRLLDRAEMSRVIERFASYGQPAPASGSGDR